SAEGECTRRYSNGSSNRLPSAKHTSSSLDLLRTLISVAIGSVIDGRVYARRVKYTPIQALRVYRPWAAADRIARHADTGCRFPSTLRCSRPGAFAARAR